MRSEPSTARRWAHETADEVLERFPDRDVYTVAAGASPSGTIHFGNFRDVMTVLPVASALRARGVPVRMLFSWDDFDRFRKVPGGAPEELAAYTGRPLTAVPDPHGRYRSYAEWHQREFEAAMADLGIKLAYRYQTSEYGSGRYDALLIQTLQKRDAIAEILYGGISEKRRRERDLDFDAYRTDFWPISVYSRFSGTDNTRITGYDGDAGISYRCEDSGRDDTIDLRRDHVAKLTWKVDWPMRWLAEDVAFEPGGADHAAPGGSFEMASAISRTVYDREPPVFMGYQFVGIRAEGTKMSGSTGLSVSPAQLLGIYEPALLKWLYLRRVPMAAFSLAFDTEVYRQYDEWDREVKAWRAGDLAEDRVDAVEQALDGLPAPPESLLPFRQVVALGQIVQWSPEALQTLAEGLGSGGDPDALAARADRARTWLERYNPDEILRLLDQPNSEFASELPEERRAHIRELHDALAAPGELDVPALEELVYGIPKQPDLEKKELGRRQRRFFQDVYELLLGREVGPRLGTFLWALDRERVLRLLDV